MIGGSLFRRNKSAVFDFSYDVAASSSHPLTEEMPWDGWIMSGILDWPGGCNNLVGIQITVDGERMIPYNTEWVSLNDTTIDLPIIRYVKKGRIIKVEIKNNDTANSHYVSVLTSVYNFYPKESMEVL